MHSFDNPTPRAKPRAKPMATTYLGLVARLQDGRWKSVSTRPALWLTKDPQFEVEMKMFFTRGTWQPAEARLIGSKPNMRYRARLRPEFLKYPYTLEVTK